MSSVCACLQDIYLENPNVHWEDIIGLDTAKRLVKEAVVYPIRVMASTVAECLLACVKLTSIHKLHTRLTALFPGLPR